MATRISPPQNKTYYINPAYLTFVENSGYGANLIQVSASSSCYISVYDPANGIGYSDADRNYRRWKVTAYNNKFPDNEAWKIYVRLESKGSSALVIYDKVLRGVSGGVITVTTDENGNEVQTEEKIENPPYYFIRIGDVTATNGTTIREITYDTGYLESDAGKNASTLDEMWELDKYSTPWLIRAKQWLTDFTVKGFIKLIGGLKFSKGKGGDEKIITDIKRSIDDAPEYMVDENGVFMKDEEGNYIPNPDYVPVSDETIPTTKYIQSKSDDRYLKKYEPDETEHLIKFTKSGIECGEYNEGALVSLGGSGTKFDGNGYGEMNGLRLREFLEVPELRFNRIDVVSGILWNSVAFGLIETVDEGRQTCTLKLEGDERSGLHVEDICIGIFCDFGEGTADNATDPGTMETIDLGDDANGFPKMYGFSTSYFSPTNIIQNEAGVFEFEYMLQPGTSVHPKPSMKFAVYGNFNDKSRQASAYSCRTYQRYLNNVDNWKIVPDDHIYAHFGKLDGLTIGGKAMTGYGSYQHNVYLTGSTYEFSKQQKEELKGEDAYSVTLSEFVGIIRIDETGEIIGEQYMPYNVVTGEENVVTEDANVVASGYLLRTRIQATRGTKELVFSDTEEEGTYTASISPVGCVAELTGGNIYVSEITDTEYCYIGITVNCEGVMSFPLTYQVKMVKDGSVAFEAWVFARSQEEPQAPSGGTYESPMPDPNPAADGTEWHDGIPDGKLQVWMSSRIFTADGKYPQQEAWSTPRPMTDTTDFVQVFHAAMEDPAQQPEPPGSDPGSEDWVPDNGWTDDPTPLSVWMATNVCRNGVWKGWKVVKVQGESGLDALVLVSSVSTVSRNSFGSYEPSSLRVRAMRGGVEEEANITVYGVKKDHTAVAISECSSRSSVDIDLTTLYAANYSRLVFRAYEGIVNDYYNETSIAETSVAFVGDGSSGPMPRNRGEYSSTEAYFYNDMFRDFVWMTTSSGATVYMRNGYGIAYSENGTYTDPDLKIGKEGGVMDIPPSNSDYWVEVPKTVMTAIDTALVENANIAGFMFKGGRMVAQNNATNSNPLPDSKLILDGTTGYFKCVDADVDGNITVGSMSYKVLYADGGTYDLTGVGMAVGHGTFELPSVENMYSTEIKVLFVNWSRVARYCVLKSVDGTPIRISDNRGFGKNVTEYALSNNSLHTAILVYDSLTSDPYWIVTNGIGGSEGGGISLYVDTELSAESEYPVQNKVIAAKFEEFGPFVYDKTLGYWTFNGDLLVTGGVTMYGDVGQYTPSTVMDGVVVDGVTIQKNSDGQLEVIGGTGGGTADSVAWDNITGKPSFATVATSGSYNDLQNKPTALKSPYAFTVNNSSGVSQVSYDGSAAKSLTLSKAMVGLGNVENTALSTWTGSSYIKTLGTITSGTWNGSAIGASYLPTATTSAKGVASFDSKDFAVSNGKVSLNARVKIVEGSLPSSRTPNTLYVIV